MMKKLLCLLVAIVLTIATYAQDIYNPKNPAIEELNERVTTLENENVFLKLKNELDNLSLQLCIFGNRIYIIVNEIELYTLLNKYSSRSFQQYLDLYENYVAQEEKYESLYVKYCVLAKLIKETGPQTNQVYIDESLLTIEAYIKYNKSVLDEFSLAIGKYKLSH